MKHIKTYKDKNVLILGAGLSGIYGAELLRKLGAKVTIIDSKPLSKFSKSAHQKLTKLSEEQIVININHQGVNQKQYAKNLIPKYHYEAVDVKGICEAKLKKGKYDLLVKSPGIPYTNPIVHTCQKLNIPITVEVEIASEVNPGRLFCVTGSNGKTTTTMLITRMLNAKYQELFDAITHNGKNHTQLKFINLDDNCKADNKIDFSKPNSDIIKQIKHNHPFTFPTANDAGNIGISASKTAEHMSSVDTMVMEISSFMLASIIHLHPHIAVITNIYSNHLDWHKTRANYVHDKMNITKNQNKNDYLVMNFNSEEWRELSQESRAKVIPFCTNGYTKQGAYEENGKLYFRGRYVMDARDINIHGQYNVENTLAAIAVAKLNGVSNQAIQHVMKTFKGASNRNQYVTTYHGRTFFNDSKSTDVESTQAAVNSFSRPEILLLGGLDRGYPLSAFNKLVPDLKKHVRGVVAFGQTRYLMTGVAKEAGIKNIGRTTDLPSAVRIAYKISKPNDIILLSPANASWDQYPNFEVRGKAYREAIKKVIR